jgi:hypothetical protein
MFFFRNCDRINVTVMITFMFVALICSLSFYLLVYSLDKKSCPIFFGHIQFNCYSLTVTTLINFSRYIICGLIFSLFIQDVELQIMLILLTKINMLALQLGLYSQYKSKFDFWIETLYFINMICY